MSNVCPERCPLEHCSGFVYTYPMRMLLLIFAATAVLLAGCGTPTTDVTGVKAEDRFNPAMTAAQRQHMMNRGPKAP